MTETTMANLGLKHDSVAYSARVTSAAHEMAAAVLARADREDTELAASELAPEAQKGAAFNPAFLSDFEVIAAAAEYTGQDVQFQQIDHNR
jgi:hypothetical protein